MANASEEPAPAVCNESLTRVLALLGERWTGQILATLVRGGPGRFTELGRWVPGISESMLSERLGKLTEAGLIEREVIEGPPLGVVYRVSERGKALEPALQELERWAERYL